MKKTLLVLLVLFITMHNGISQNIHLDTLVRYNGEKIIEKINYSDSTIDESCIDSLGQIKFELHYKIVDSVKCFNCKTHYELGELTSVDYLNWTRGNYSFSDTSIHAIIKVGDWNYYENGKIVKTINYLPLAYEYEWVHCDYKYDNHGSCLPCGGGGIIDFLIDKIIYYDHNQNVVKVENFENGVLVSVWNYEVD